MLGLIVVSSIGLGYASIELQRKVQPPRLTMHELIAIRRLEAHDAAKLRNDKARQVCELERAVRPITFGPLYGARPATVGTAFDLEQSWHQAHGFTTRTKRRGDRFVDARATIATNPSVCGPSEDAEVFCPFRCAPDPRQDCAALSWQLSAAWGWPDMGAWRDRAHRILARVVEDGGCELRFQRYVAPGAWIAMTTTAEIPLALIGESEHRLPAHAGAGTFTEQGWPLLVTGKHMLEANLDVVVENGRIVGFEVRGEMDEDGGADELHALVGRARRSVHVELWTRGTTFEVTVGKSRL